VRGGSGIGGERARVSDGAGGGDEGARERESGQVVRGCVAEVVRGPGQGEGKRWHWWRQLGGQKEGDSETWHRW